MMRTLVTHDNIVIVVESKQKKKNNNGQTILCNYGKLTA